MTLFFSSTETAETVLSINDLREIIDQTWEARPQWYNVGLGLGISADNLDAMQINNQGNCDACFREIFKKWLRNHRRPTWSLLAEALESPSVGMAELANKIAAMCKSNKTRVLESAYPACMLHLACSRVHLQDPSIAA